MTDLHILQKTYDMYLYLYQALKQYPKSEKYSIVTETKQSAHELLKLLITSHKKYHKRTTLQETDVQLDILRHYIRLGYDLGYLPMKKYEVLSGYTTEIGKMLGGWIKSTT